MFKNRRHIVFCLTVLLCLPLWSDLAHADTRLPLVSPWITDPRDGDHLPIVPGAEPRIATQRSPRSSAATPAAPLLTPRDTRALLEGRGFYDEEDEDPSALEETYSRRIVDELEQFGYDLFGTPDDKTDQDNNIIASHPSGAVQDDFILNNGDALTVTFRGQRDDSKTYTINNQGFLIIDDLPPLMATGRPIAQVRAMLEAQIKPLHNTSVYVSLESVRQIGVLIVGHVKKPGRRNMTVFHSVLDALMAAGGIEKTGSLRQVKLVRSGRSTYIDLYGLLVHGDAGMDLTLRDGDRIIVPPVGPTVAVTGGVKRPGIYELSRNMQDRWFNPQDEADKLSLDEMLALGGGVLSPGQNRFMKLGLTLDGEETVEEVSAPYEPAFGNGTILMVAASDEKRADMVELAGNSRRGGLHALKKTPTLSALLPNDKIFGPDIYPLIGVIERWDEEQLARELIAFPPLLVLKKTFDRKLQEGDVVHLFSRAQIKALQDSPTERDIEQGSLPELPDDLIDDPLMVNFLQERAAILRGAVRSAGLWPVAEGVSLKNLLSVAGGTTLDANIANIELTSAQSGEGHQTHGRSGTRRTTINLRETNPKEIMIAAGDAIRVNQKYGKTTNSSVLVMGEVKHPGYYDLLPGDKMSDVLERAGGLTDQGYPSGAIFSRASERKAEEARFRMQAQDLEIKLAAALEQKDEPDATQIAAVQQLIDQLRQAEAVGRITIEADPGALTAQPELDMLLESGDRLYIPKRPLMVRVAGEVLSPAALQFRKDKDPRDYIMESGGFTYHADKDRAFVLYPDGSAQPLLVNNWNHKAIFIPPGSTIVVPRDPKPFDFLQTARDLSQIIANLAITGIWLDDLGSD